jgi:hypothetical protein
VDKLTNLNFQLGPGGWTKASWVRESGVERSAFARFAENRIGSRTYGRPVWRLATIQVDRPTAETLADIPLLRLELAFNTLEISAELKDMLDEPVPADLEQALKRTYRNAPRKKLERPATRRLDDDFYRQVALTYRAAAARGLNPVQTIADDAAGGVYSNAARWVAKARELRFLPKAQRGKVTT